MILTLFFFTLLGSSFAVKLGPTVWQKPDEPQRTDRNAAVPSWYTEVDWLDEYKFFLTEEFCSFDFRRLFAIIMQAENSKKYFIVVLTIDGGVSTTHMVSQFHGDIEILRAAAARYLNFFGSELTLGVFDVDIDQQFFNVTKLEDSVAIDFLTEIRKQLPQNQQSLAISTINVHPEIVAGAFVMEVKFNASTDIAMVPLP